MESNDQQGSTIGVSLQKLGTFIIAIGILGSIVLWVVLINTGYSMDYMSQAYGYHTPYLIAGWGTLIIGPFLSVVSGMLVKGFGRLIENSEPKTIKSLPMPKEAFR